MKLWLLTQSDNKRYNTYDSCVVAANTEQEAKEIHPREQDGWKYHRSSWANSPETVKAICIGTANDGTNAGLVIASFNAG